jgi:rhodanese-related sulfurtransferase
MKVTRQSPVWLLLAGGLGCLLSGCGTNKFQQELQTERAAIKLTRETTSGGYELVSTSELQQLLDGDQPVVLVDAMPAEASYNRGHIPGAVNFEFPKEIMDSWDSAVMGQRSQAEYEQLLGTDKARPIVVYCGYVECARSHNAAVCAQESGYTQVKRYPGGVFAWRGAGLPLSTE